MIATFLKSVTDLAELPYGEKPHIAMVGRSNVGKSTLINRLTQKKHLARVSSAPGRTQTINLYDVDGRVYLVDLPGYGFATRSKSAREVFSHMIYQYVGKTKQVKLVLLIIDARRGLMDLDKEMLEFLRKSQIPSVLITNKMDKLSNSEAGELKRTLKLAYPDLQLIPHSDVTSKNVGEIWLAIENATRAA